MPSISFGGLGNGLDFGRVVAQLVQLQRLPIDRLSQTQQTLQTKLSDYGTLGTKLLALQSAAHAIRLGTSFDRAAATVSDEQVLTASASSTATPGNYTLSITQLAAAHQITNKGAKAVASTTADIVSGASGTFTFTVGGGAPQTVALSDTATLDDLKTAINDLGAGVTASIINAGAEASPSYRLVLTAANSGASNTIVITADTTDLDFVNSSGTGGTDTLQAAQDAVLVVGDPSQNPVTLQRSSNTITDAIAGVTLNLKSPTSPGSTVSLNVTRDIEAVKANIKALVTAYNDVVKFIGARSTYDPVAKQGGLFLNEGAPKVVLTRIRQALSDEVSGLTGYTSVATIGFQTERDGTITLDESVLDQALSTNYTDVKNLFINRSGIAGVAQRLYQTVDGLDDVADGVLTIRKGGLSKEIDTLADQIQRKEDALTAYEDRLRRQYAALDGLLRQMQSQLDFLKSRL